MRQRTESERTREDGGTGIVAQDWQVGALEDWLSFISYGFTNPMPTVAHGIYMITAADINGGSLHLVTARQTSEQAYRTLLTPKSKPKKNDILLTKDGTLGRLAVVGDETICINQSVAVLRPNERVDAGFLKALLESPIYQRTMVENAGGSTIKHIYISVVNRMPIAVPPTLLEQRAIAAALSDVDALIGALDRLIAKKRDLKQAAMQQLLTGQTRLPGFSANWDAGTRLGEQTIKVGSGITPTGGVRVYRQAGRPFIRSQNVGWGALILDDVAFIDEATHFSFEATELQLGDVLLNITGASIGRSTVVDSRVVGGNVNQHVCIIRPNPSALDSHFLNFLLLSELGQNQIDSFQAGGNRQGLNFVQVRSLAFPTPSLAEQSAIAAVLSDMDLEVVSLQQRRDKTRMLKQGMMQELLTGRIRLV